MGWKWAGSGPEPVHFRLTSGPALLRFTYGSLRFTSAHFCATPRKLLRGIRTRERTFRYAMSLLSFGGTFTLRDVAPAVSERHRVTTTSLRLARSDDLRKRTSLLSFGATSRNMNVAPKDTGLLSEEPSGLWTTLARERKRSSRDRAQHRNQRTVESTIAMSFK